MEGQSRRRCRGHRETHHSRGLTRGHARPHFRLRRTYHSSHFEVNGAKPKKYQWSLTSPSSVATATLFALAKEKLPTALETKFAAFPVDLIDTHGKDIIVGSNEPSRAGSPAPPSTTAVPAGSKLGSTKKATSQQQINTSVVEVEATFHASASDLFALLTDEKRIPMWSRASAKVPSERLRTRTSINADGTV